MSEYLLWEEATATWQPEGVLLSIPAHLPSWRGVVDLQRELRRVLWEEAGEEVSVAVDPMTPGPREDPLPGEVRITMRSLGVIAPDTLSAVVDAFASSVMTDTEARDDEFHRQARDYLRRLLDGAGT